MKIALIGCGAMGRAAACALATDPSCHLTLVDQLGQPLTRLADLLGQHYPNATIRTEVLDLKGGQAVRKNLTALLQTMDATALALPWPATRTVMQAALEAHAKVTSITRPDYADLAAMRAWPKLERAQILFPCGLEPGLSEIFALATCQSLAEVQELAVYCGGVPEKPVPPLGYRRLFDAYLPLTPRDAYTLEHGRLCSTRRFQGVETIEVAGVGQLECHHDGMVPWLGEHPSLAAVGRVTQKTVRWPGFAAIARFLDQAGLLSEEAIAIGASQHPVVPREFVETVLAPLTQAGSGDVDVTVLRVDAIGVGSHGGAIRLRTQLIDRSTSAAPALTSMARTTGFTLASVTRMLARDEIEARGLLWPHEVIVGTQLRRLIDDLKGEGISIELAQAL